MPSAANGKSDKPASSEAVDNSPVRQIMTIVEHKIRNLEKRKSKLQSYRDLQKAGKELNADQKVAVAKYDEVVQTLEFARDLSKQMASVAAAAERDAKKQAKKDAWVRYAADTSKIREVLLILDCLMQMGNSEAREDFLNGANGAAKLTEEDLKILDDLYPEVTPKHEVNEEGQPGFPFYATKAAEHLYSIIDGKPKEVFGTTYAHIKEIVTSVHECGYFDKSTELMQAVEPEEEVLVVAEAECEVVVAEEVPPLYPALPVPPAPAVVPPPAYPLRPLPPITLQEVEHAYFSQQYPQQRPIAEVIGSQNFFFLQESEINSPVGTPQPVLNQPSPGPIPTQTFTNQHFVAMPHYPHPEVAPVATFQPPPEPVPAVPAPAPVPAPVSAPEEPADDWQEVEPASPEREDPKTQGQGDAQPRYQRRYPRGGSRPPTNGFRGRGYQNRQNDYNNRRDDYQRKDSYQNRQYNDNYRHKEGYSRDNYYGNGDSGNGQENGRERYGDSNQNYQGGFKGRGRGRGARGGSRPPRGHYRAKADNPE